MVFAGIAQPATRHSNIRTSQGQGNFSLGRGHVCAANVEAHKATRGTSRQIDRNTQGRRQYILPTSSTLSLIALYLR